MNILDIAIAKKLAGGGGGSGTDNYNDLSNLPKINDTTLSGNKSSSALGLQSEINSDSKLASDLVDDTNQDNKFVTSTEKNTWNGKQNAIDADHKINADYVDDSTSTNKFVTASDKETWNAKQNAIDSDHKLSSSLVNFSNAEAAALASGIDSNDVQQIGVNQTNILYTLGKTGKNLLSLNTIPISWSSWNIIEPIKAGTYILHGVLPHKPQAATDVTNYAFDFKDANDNTVGSVVGVGWENIYNNGMQLTLTGTATKLKYWAAGNTDDATNMMVCTPEDWAIGHDYAPFALSNADLTGLQAEDRAGLVECVDGGAKNIFDITTPNLLRDTVVTPLSNGGATLSCNNAAWTQYGQNIDVEVGKTYKVIVYIDSITGSVGTDFNVNFTQDSSFLPITPTNTGEYSVEVDSTNTILGVSIFINNSGTTKSLSINMRMMICTLDDWKISQNFAPYALPNSDLTYLEAEDRAALAEVVDNGLKNLANPALFKSGGYISDTTGVATNSSNSAYMDYLEIDSKQIYYITPLSGLSGNWGAWYDSTKTFISGFSGYEMQTPPPNAKYLRLTVSYQDSNPDYASNFMVCKKPLYVVSPAYAPYQNPPKIILCKNHVFTTDTTLAYTGASFIIPENTTVRITASAISVRSQPSEIAISNYSDQNLILAHNSAVEGKTNGIITTELVFSTSGSTYTVAVLAKYAGATENQIILVVEKLN